MEAVINEVIMEGELVGEQAEKLRAILLKKLHGNVPTFVARRISFYSSNRRQPSLESSTTSPPQIVLTLDEGESEAEIQKEFEEFLEERRKRRRLL